MGLTVYSTGRPCKYGHIDTRLVSNSVCSECNRQKALKWQIENPEKASLRDKRWQAANPGVPAQRMRDWYKANTERHKSTMRDYFLARPWLRAALSSKARADHYQRTPSWLTEDDIWMMDEAYELAKLRQQMTGFPWHVDHVIPLRGERVSGLHVPLNLQVIPALVNMRKGNRYAP